MERCSMLVVLNFMSTNAISDQMAVPLSVFTARWTVKIFSCSASTVFRKDPHYHYDPSGKNDQRPLDKASVPDSVAWTLEQLGQNLVEMIHTAGYASVAEVVDQAAVTQVLSEVESLMRSED